MATAWEEALYRAWDDLGDAISEGDQLHEQRAWQRVTDLQKCVDELNQRRARGEAV